jgi:hypothetical protein
MIHAALGERLAAPEAQRHVASRPISRPELPRPCTRGVQAAAPRRRHDSADPYNNTDNAGHEQNQDPQYNGK